MKKNIWNEIESKKHTFTSKELEIYEIFKNDYLSFRSSTATEIADRYNISQSSISRFCQKLGFDGFSDFRLSLVANSYNSYDKYDIKTSSSSFVDGFSNIIQTMHKELDSKHLTKIANRILSSNTVFVNGYGASDLSAHILSFNCVSNGVKVLHQLPSSEQEYLHIQNSNDTIILFSSINPSHKDLFSLLEEMPKKDKPHVILVSGTSRHPFANKVDDLVVLPRVSQDFNGIFLPNFSQIVFSYLLVQYIMFTKLKQSVNDL